jgi:hypothetical protein
MKIPSLYIITLCLLLQISHNKAFDEQISNNRDYKTVVILLHLYNLNLMDEFITRINRFMNKNDLYNFYIKINIPIAKNIETFNKINPDKEIEQELAYTFCLESSPYHPKLITHANCAKLYFIAKYLQQRLIISPDKIQIIFSENRGMDIGGFFLLLDQLIKSNLKHDYIVKLHTKSDLQWRNKLLTILNLDLKKYQSRFDCMYAFKKICHEGIKVEINPRKFLKKILQQYDLPEKKRFAYTAGTMFIASSKITDFFTKYDRVALFKQLNPGYISKNGQIEHGYERFFGYLMEWLKLKVRYIK